MNKAIIKVNTVMAFESPFNVTFINSDAEQRVTEFTCNSADSLQTVVSALSAFYSGDEYGCRINGVAVDLESDYGLARCEVIQ